jgi:hypothetical protein
MTLVVLGITMYLIFRVLISTQSFIYDRIVVITWAVIFTYAFLGFFHVYDRLYRTVVNRRTRETSLWRVSLHLKNIFRNLKRDEVSNTFSSISVAVVSEYFSSTCPPRDRAEIQNNSRILPANFRVYALCVKRAMGKINRLLEDRRIIDVTVYTLFPRTIFEWYNPFVKVESDGGKPHAVAYTEDWWEAYKQFMSQYRNANNIKIVRLMEHPEKFTTIEDEIDFSDTDEQRFEAKYFIRANDVRVLAKASDPGTVRSDCAVRGFKPIVSIKTDQDLYSGELRTRALVNCILEKIDDHVSPPGFVPLLDHFENAHHTSPLSKRALTTKDQKQVDQSGCFIAYSKKTIFRWGQYADVFAVRFRTSNGSEVHFGVALQADGFNDAEGIKFLRKTEIVKFMQEFEEELKDASSHFCVARRHTGEPNAASSP